MYTYLASPYSSGSWHHTDKKLMQQERYTLAMAATAWLMNQGRHVYSPIVHCHELAKRYSLPTDFTFWKSYNLTFIDGSRALYVLTLPGWLDSTGVQGEITYARDLTKPVFLLNKANGTYQIVDYSLPL